MQTHVDILKNVTRFVKSVTLIPVVGNHMFRKYIAQWNTSFKNFQLGATTYLNPLTRIRDNTLSDIVHV